MLTAVHTVTLWLNQVGYLAVYLVLFVESIGIPSPSEIILLFAGYEVWLGHFSYPIVVLVAAAGSTTGATGAYFIARLGGRPLILKHFRWIFRTPERLAYWENYFRTKGDKVVLIGRIISGVRMIISYPAGLFEMPFRRFLLYTVIGSILWPLIAVTAGYLLGPHVISGLTAAKKYETPVIIVVVAAAAAWWWGDRRKKKRQTLPLSSESHEPAENPVEAGKKP
jgi:membrane protein DedA with SNARE-associated domain